MNDNLLICMYLFWIIRTSEWVVALYNNFYVTNCWYKTAAWPIQLEIDKPSIEEKFLTIEAIFYKFMDDDLLQYNAFKILLSSGIIFIKHNSSNRGFHLTTIRITDKEVSFI